MNLDRKFFDVSLVMLKDFEKILKIGLIKIKKLMN
jgi:hypothetical protein